MATPVALTIAGSDCSAGAGLQADLKTFSSLGVHGLTAVTCVVSETPLTVSQVHPVPPTVLGDQIELLLKSYPVAAIKTGMLFSKAHIEVVCGLLENSTIPLIVDPVMVASTGDPLLQDDALAAVSDQLLPLATVITPNLPEAGFLLRREITSHIEQEDCAHALARKFNAACYLKGGHFEASSGHRDLLVVDESCMTFESPHLDLPQTHGTGCTLSAALAGSIAKGKTLHEAARIAHRFTHHALKNSRIWSTPQTSETIAHLNQDQG